MSNYSDNFWKKFFILASLWNISAGPLMPVLYGYFPFLIYTSEGLKYTHNPVFDSFFYFLIAFITLFGFGFYMLSRDLMLNRGIVWLGVAGKICWAIIIFHMYFLQYLTAFVLVSLIGDIVLALFFLVFLNQTKNRVRVNNWVG